MAHVLHEDEPMIRTRYQRVLIHGAALLAALTAVYVLVGFFAIPYLLQREVDAYAQRAGLDVSIGELRTNPFLLTLDAHRLRVEEPGEKRALAAPLLHLDLRWASLWQRGWMLDSATLQSPRIRLVLREQTASPDKDAPASSDATTQAQKMPRNAVAASGNSVGDAETAVPRIIIERLRLSDARVALAAGIVPEEKPLDVGPIDLSVQGLSTAAGASAAFELTAELLEEARLAATGTVGLDPLRTTGTVEVQDLQLASVLPLVMRSHPIAIPSGNLTLDFRYATSLDNGNWALRLNALSATLRELYLPRPAAEGPMLALDRLSVRGVDLDAMAGELVVAEAMLEQGAVTAVRNAQGDWNFTLLAQAFAGPDEAPAQRDTTWQVQLGAVALESIALHVIDRSLPQPLEARVRSIDAQASLALRIGASGIEARAEDVGFALKDISALAPGGQESLATLARLDLQGGVADTTERRISARRVALAEGVVAIVREEQGGFALSGKPPPSPRREDAAVPANAPPDAAKATSSTAAALKQASAAAPGAPFDTRGERAFLRVAAQPAPAYPANRDAQAPATRSEASGAGAWQIAVDNFQLEGIALRYLDRTLALPLRFAVGSLDAQAQVEVAIPTQSKEAPVQAQLRSLSVDAAAVRAELGEKPAPLELATLALKGGTLSTAEQHVGAESLLLAQTEIDFVRTDAGTLRLLGIDWTLLDTGDDAPGPSPVAGWTYAVDQVILRDIALHLADRNTSPPLSYDLLLQAAFTRVASGATEPIGFEATLQAEQGGSLQASGTLAQDLGQARAQLRLAQFALAPLDPLLARYAALQIVSGTAAAAMTVEYAGAAGKKEASPSLHATGSFTTHDVQIVETATDRNFASWQSLAAEGVELGISPDRLEIAEVTIAGPEAQLVVSEKRTLNLTRVLREDYRDDAGMQSTAESPPTAERFPLRIGRISVSDGTLEFADFSLVLPFATRVHAVSGAVVGISTAAGAHAELQFDGAIADYGSARASGRLNAFAPTQFMDVTAEFDNVLMPPFSPYTATFAGRTIESGRLWLELEYRIKDKQLSGVNEIVAQNLELGKRVENPEGGDLPLELGLALLTDAKGRVRLRIPVSGDVGDPQFEYTHLIREAIGGAFRKVVSAPFRALAALFGGRDAEVVRSVAFEPGSGVLPAAEREELERLAQALEARPALELVVRGPYDPVADARALRTDQLRRTIAQRLGRDVRAGEPADPVAFTDPASRRVIDALLRDRFGEGDYAAIRHAIEATGRPFYPAAFEELASRIEVPESRLETLAAQRARAITEHLTASGVAPGRIATPGVRSIDAEQDSGIVATLDVRARSEPS